MVALKRAIAIASICLCLSGCGATKPAAESDKIRLNFNELNNAAFHAKILSDFNQSALEFELDYVYNKQDNDTLTIVMPEILSGIRASIAGEQKSEFTLQYDDTIIDMPITAQPGMTPADAIAYVLYELRASSADEVWSEQIDGVALTVLKYVESSDDGSQIVRQVWLNEETSALVCAEIYADGMRILQIIFSAWSENSTA